MKRVAIGEFLSAMRSGVEVFDVRTPAEFEKGHIPGARNLPLLTNDERVVVGTTYKQEGRHPAIKAGLDFIGPRMREMIDAVEAVVGPPGSQVAVHCWRGGMRSGSVGWLLELYGYRVIALEGGYKAFRHWVLAQLETPPPVLVVGGRTGGGKTEMLEALHEAGEPVIDLEGLAIHRGSVFGGLLLPDQPSQEHFENLLGVEFERVKEMGGRVWVEDEGRMVGHRHLPNALMAAMKAAHVLAVNVSFESRLERLVEVYGDADQSELRECFEKIRKRLGHERTDEAIAQLEDGDLAAATRTALAYYDKAYDYGLAKRADGTVHPVEIDGEMSKMARALIDASQSLGIYEA